MKKEENVSENIWQHQQRAPTNTDAELWSKMGFGLKQYILHRCWLGKSSLLLPAHSSERFPHGVCGRKNLFSCWQISYHAGSSFVEDIPIIKRPKTVHEHRDVGIYMHGVHKSEAETFQREKKIENFNFFKVFLDLCPSCEGTHVLAPHTDRLFSSPQSNNDGRLSGREHSGNSLVENDGWETFTGSILGCATKFKTLGSL